MKKIKALAIFNALSLIGHILTAYFVQNKMVAPLNVGEVSARYESLFTPAGITFGIWGIIYTALGILCLYHIVIAYKHDKNHPSNTDLERMGLYFMITNIASAGWLVAWVSERLLISVGLIAIQLFCLIAIHIRLGIYSRIRHAASKTCTQFPLSIYLGWISIAVIANMAAYLTAIGWNGMGLTQMQWTIIMISIAVALALIMIFVRHNIYFGFVIAWGLYGILLKLKAKDDNAFDYVINTAWLGFGLILISCLFQIFRNSRFKQPRKIFPSASAPLK